MINDHPKCLLLINQLTSARNSIHLFYAPHYVLQWCTHCNANRYSCKDVVDVVPSKQPRGDLEDPMRCLYQNLCLKQGKLVFESVHISLLVLKRIRHHRDITTTLCGKEWSTWIINVHHLTMTFRVHHSGEQGGHAAHIILISHAILPISMPNISQHGDIIIYLAVHT
uniref:Uncharacterized protein n=1 Tax=Arundo donax TaxID=35708 RepID=A0A0A9CF71_ARUDO